MNRKPTAKLVRVHDRLLTTIDSAATPTPWRINPRTVFLETRAGLSWTGVRPYRTATGVIRVLHRPEQFTAPGYLRTLRLLPATEGHPFGGVDVSAANEADLRVGTVGDSIEVETLAGYARPVGNVSVSRPSTIVKMVDAATWEDACARYEQLGKLGITHDGSAPCTGTSQGYCALWAGPFVDAEIINERDDGGLVGAWVGPNGAEEYDVEHVVDPDCEIIQQFARDANFDPTRLGGNHEAVCLPELGGRGGAQSELLRVVDSQEIAIPFDLTRLATRVVVQVPKQAAPTNTAAAVDSDSLEAVASQQPRETPKMKTIQLEIGLGRDAFQLLNKTGALSKLASKNVTIPQTASVLIPVSDEIDPKALIAKIDELKGFVGSLSEMIAEMTGEVAAKEEEMADMMSKEDAEAAVVAKEAELAEAKTMLAEASKASDALTKERDSLTAQIAPLRAKELADLKTVAETLAVDVKDAVDAAAVRRAIVLAKCSAEITADASDAEIAGAFKGLRIGLQAATPPTPPSAPTPPNHGPALTNDGRDPFAGVPRIAPVPNPTPANDSADTKAFDEGLAAMGG